MLSFLACRNLQYHSRAYILPKSRRPLDTPYLIIFHLLVTTAIALVAAGAAKLNDTALPSDQLKRSHALVKAGMVMLILGWLSLAAFTVATLQPLFARRPGKSAENRGAKHLLLAVTLSMPFLGIRILERLIYFFTENPELNPVTGSLGLRVGLEVIEEVIVTLLLITAGIVTRNIK